VYGQEQKEGTVPLGRMNLALHGLSGDIRLANSYYDDLHAAVGSFDFVMANPPFNVNGIDKSKLEGDARRFPFGLPRPDNGNYIWIQLFNCLNVVGNTAYLSGEVVASNRDDIPIGTPFYTVVVDVSPDGAGDMVGPVYLTGLTCADVQPAEFTITTGNVVVEQCLKIAAEGECTGKT
jgi:N-6 DNA Methylase